MRGLLTIVVSVALGAPAVAQAPVTLASTFEAGWTSNVSENEDGAGDVFLRQAHDLSIQGMIGQMALRGGLQVEQTRFGATPIADELSVTAGLEAGLALGEGAALRAGYALSRDWSGGSLDLADIPVTISNSDLTHEALAELTLAAPGRALVLGIDHIQLRPGLSRLDPLPLPPQKLAPDAGLTTFRLDGEWALGAAATSLARARAFVTQVDEDERLSFLREPADGVQLAAGLRLGSGSIGVEAFGGVDLVWPRTAPERLQVLPHVDVSAEVALSDRRSVYLRGATGVERLKPIDNVAGATWESELGLRADLPEDRQAVLALSHNRETGLYGAGWSSRTEVSARFTTPLFHQLRLTLGASQAWLDSGAGVVPVSRLGATLTASI
ncbi:MAG: hypothetical protein KIT02_06285 [Devosia sp.]|uniref:hypothetical protein n=1 Tax=Devosia sp. TaxID=1871048 RepID=UPI0024C9E071|nr:hypothetical protein [Devosia sp.]UYO00811.1 MAG: hypothetical protein KIT02_06285 [Devosia sp.]